MAGLRVVRGPDWSLGNDDGGEGHLGTVTHVNDDKMVSVLWDMGTSSRCRVGQNGKFDLRVFDNATVGVIFKDEKCSECTSQHFFGMKWKCIDCSSIVLCSICYFRDKHDTKHKFARYTLPYSDSDGVKVPNRDTSLSVSSLGMYPGSKVVRGKDWQYGDQDEGKDKTGTVRDIRSFGEDLSHRNAVAVQWSSGKLYKYRVGHKGKVDLKCLEETKGFRYYRDHLPVLDSDMIKQLDNSKTTLEIGVGDKVCVKINKEDLKTLQQSHGGYSVKMESIIGKIGEVDSFTPAGDVNVKIDGDMWVLNPCVISKVQVVSLGDTVLIKNDMKTVEALQTGHGGWHPEMTKVLGKVGKVVKFTSKKDVIVRFGKKCYVFNKACLIPAPGSSVYELESTEELSLSEGTGVSDALGVLIAQLLLADVRSRQISQCFLREAVSGNTLAVHKMIRDAPSLCNTVIKGTTALIASSFEGHEAVVKVLLENGAKTEVKDGNGNTALFAAVAGENDEIVKLLLDNGADVNVGNKNKRTPLHVAARNGYKIIVLVLLHSKCEVNVQDSSGYTALHDAISGGHEDITVLLVDNVKINFRISNSKGFNCLQHAALKGNKIAAEKIVAKCPLMVDDGTKDGYTALHISAVNNRLEIATTILVKGKGNVQKKNDKGRTALHLACREAYYEMVELLIGHGADVSGCDDHGDSCLHHVLGGKKFEQMIGFLFVKKVDDKAERIKIACILIKAGAQTDVKNKNNKAAIDMTDDEAIKNAVLDCLKKRDAKTDGADSDQATTPVGEQSYFQEMIVPCFICFRQTGSVTNHPCKHRVLCPSCCYKVDECPVCRKTIERRVDPAGKEVLNIGDLCKVQ